MRDWIFNVGTLVKLNEILQREFDVITHIYNDAFAQSHGISGVTASTLYVSIGTSIGGTYLHNGVPLRGERGFGGEIGHIPTSYSKGKCTCGRYNCLDLTTSGWSLERDLGSYWWLNWSQSVDSRLEIAGKALAEVNSQLVPFIDHAELIVAGQITSYNAFKKGLEPFDNNAYYKTIWPQTCKKFFSNLDELTWAGLSKLSKSL